MYRQGLFRIAFSAHNYLPEEDLSHFFQQQFIMNIMDSSPLLASVMKQNAHCGELKYDLSCELYRMSTFSTFPVNVPVSERRLARAGFYYTGVQDKVKCFSCGLVLDNWQPGDNAMEKHK